MATISPSPVAFTGKAASDLLRSSSNGFTGVPLKTLGRTRFSSKTRNFSVVAKLRKMKKKEYPWPDNPDPNVPGGILAHVSSFKPLKEKPKPFFLDFEKPLLKLEETMNDVRKMANETGLNMDDQIRILENKYQQTLKDLYTRLTPIQRVYIARHPNRPTFLDHVFNITEKFVELHGDRAGYDDPAIVTGIGTIDGRRYMFIGHQKGRNTKESIKRNFGMPTPHGYRKALRMMHYADHHKFPIVTFIDTPGAFADLKCEELGQGEAIAQNLRTMFGLKVPIISFVIGEGGSGGALAIGCANILIMLENAVFYVASPEACAAILWKTAKAAPKAARKLRITSYELRRLQIADAIIPEPLGGAHADPSWTSQQIKLAINLSMDALSDLDTEVLLEHRRAKFRKLGGGREVPMDPKKKVNMKKKDKRVSGKTPVAELEGEIEKLKAQILKAKESSKKPPQAALDKMIVKLKKEVDLELSEAAQILGYSDKLAALREKLKTANSKDQLILMGEFEKLKDEFDRNLPSVRNYPLLQSKLNMLKELSKAKSMNEKKVKSMALKNEINKKLKEVVDQSEIKEKIEALKEAQNGESDEQMKEKIAKLRKEINLELAKALKSTGLDVAIVKPKTSGPELKSKVQSLNEQTNKKIKDLMNSPDLKNMITVLKLEIAKAGKKPDAASKIRIEALKEQLKHRLSAVISASELKEKHEQLQGEFAKAIEVVRGSDESRESDYAANESSATGDEVGVKFIIGTNNSVPAMSIS